MTKAGQIALKINETCKALGWTHCVSGGGVLTISKKFTPGSNEEFVKADGEYYSILSLVPQTCAGSTWGTDGGGIGALSAIKNGHMIMNKSGCNRNVLKALLTLEVL